MQEYQPNPGTVVVIHFFSERTDGVSLQIKENARVLSILGWKVIECSADAIGDDEVPGVDDGTARVDDVRHVAVLLRRIGREEWLGGQVVGF